MKDCFALLDDCMATAAEPRSRLYTGYVKSLACGRDADLPAVFESLEQALTDQWHAVGLFSYELGAQLLNVAHAESGYPPAQILLFERCERLDAAGVERWLAAQENEPDAPAGMANLHANANEETFRAAIRKIRAYIGAGDTYQVNYTYRLRGEAFGSSAGLYRRLRQRQPAPYGALIALPDGETVLSLSPELFLRHEDGRLTARPMKGTAAASGDPEIDATRARALSMNEKNRAENLMIVDLLRNDLGRIAQLGSVQVPRLYEVSAHGGVLQMTSTITAQLREGVTLTDIFNAVYPCGSITGAPKKRTMQIIDEVEPDARGLYTGAIGWFETSRQDHGPPNFCLSVPIRTLVLQAPETNGLRRGELGVGAGIVFDSRADEEYAECQLKARFLTALPQTFELFETMHASRNGCSLLDRHLQRLCRSAHYFGMTADPIALRWQVEQACAALGEGAYRMRLTVGNNGASVQTAALTPLAAPVRVLLAEERTRSDDLFLKHKTTVRQRYDAAWRMAETQEAFDMLFFNERGELTEGGRCNVFVKINGEWRTPPLGSGVLPGVMRSLLLEDPAWSASEQVVTRTDLHHAEAIVVCNALRGVLKAEIAGGTS